MKRRQLLFGLGLSSLAAPWMLRAVYAAPGEAKVIVELLYVQSARRASLANGVLS